MERSISIIEEIFKSRKIDVSSLIIKGTIDRVSVNNEKRTFSGWGSVEVIDRQGDYLPISEFKPVMDILMERGAPVTDGHSNHQVGKITNYQYKVKPTGELGLYLTAEIYHHYASDDAVWHDIVEGNYTGFSLGGKAGTKVPRCTNMGCYNLLSNIEAWEFSIVDRPANQLALIDQVNKLAKAYKADSVATSNVTSVNNPLYQKHRNKYIISDGDEKKADAIIQEIIRKEKVYVSSAADAPSGSMVQQGKYGGMYYETKSRHAMNPPKSGNDMKETMIEAWKKLRSSPKIKELFDVLDQANAGNNSKSEHFDKQVGRYTEDRAKLHERIVEEFVGKDSVAGSEGPLAILVGGIPASGKTTLLNALKIPLFKFVIINVDDIKVRLPGYNGVNSILYDDEALDIVPMLLRKAITERRNIIIDSVMKNPQKEFDIFMALRRLGYRRKVISLVVSPKIAIIRALQRFSVSNKYVPLSWINVEGLKINEAQTKYKELVADFQLWDSTTFPPRQI